MTVFIFGNSDLSFDSMPLRIAGELRRMFSENEEWDVLGDLIVIDAVQGIEQVMVCDDLDQFKNSPRNSLHDFDAFFHLRYLKKLGKLDKIKIIGLPMTISKVEAIAKVGAILKAHHP